MSVKTLIFFLYFLLLLLIAFFSHYKQKSDTDFVLGNRSLNFWLTAFSAHASDMSSWLFMAYPALIFSGGLFYSWAAIGLVIFMFFNWQFIAPKIRSFTGKYENLTLNAYFETRFHDTKKILRTTSSILTVFFYITYISAGLVSLGYLIESLFGFHYLVGISIGLIIVAFYVILGGYTTVAWIDLVQGLFLLFVILFIPLLLLYKIEGFSTITAALKAQNLTSSLFPNFSFATIKQILFLSCGWGLGYFGQPHIITKFMGIKNIKEMHKAKYLGISWQALSLLGATLLGLIGCVFFTQIFPNPELITLQLVATTLPLFFSGLILCAILAATTNVIAAQILVVASSLAEDFYKNLLQKKASHKKILIISRLSVIITAILAFIIAYIKPATIYELVLYSWSGLGACFGPLLLISLHFNKITKKAAFFGIITGGFITAIWPLLSTYWHMQIPPLIPGFLLSSLNIFVISYIPIKNKQKVKKI